MKKLYTKVDLNYFGKFAVVEEDLTLGGIGERYVYRVSCNNTSYILKGFKIAIENLSPGNEASCNLFKHGVSKMIEVLQEYYLAKTMANLSSHFAKPLALDHMVKPASSKYEYSFIYIEILSEHAGTSLDELCYSKSIGVSEVYNFMRQTANALSLLHNLGIAHFDIKPANMVYDSKRDTLKIIDMGSAFGGAKKIATSSTVKLEGKMRSTTLHYSPPEVLKSIKKAMGACETRIVFDAIDVYSWAMAFYSLLSMKSPEDLMYECERYKCGSANDYTDYIEIVGSSLDLLVELKGTVEFEKKRFIKEILLDCLKFMPKERLNMKEIVSRMKKFERSKGIQLDYLKQERLEKEALIDLFSLRDELTSKKIAVKKKPSSKKPPADDICTECSKSITKKVKLACGHAIGKDCLIEFVLFAFLNRKAYEHSYMCTACKKSTKVQSLQLNCGCELVQLGEKVAFSSKGDGIDYGKCKAGHPLNSVDFCLINDFTSFKFVSLMMDDYLKEKASPTLVKLFNYALRKEEVSVIAWTLRNTTIATQLDLYHFYIGDEGVKVLSEALKVDRTLKCLNLGRNGITDKGAKVIGEMLKVNTTLTQLDIKNNRIEPAGAKAISEALSTNAAIALLDIGYNRIGNKGAEAISEALKTNTALATLILRSNNIECKGVKAIGEGLKANKKLNALDLSQNRIGNEGARMISEALKVNSEFAEINLNPAEIKSIEENGAIFSRESLKSSVTVASVSLKRYKIKANNKALKNLNIGYNEIGDEGAEAIAEMLKTNKVLEVLDISYIEVGYKGAKAICAALEINTTLTQLNIGHNKLEYEGAKAMGEMLKINRTLIGLDISYNNIKCEGAKSVCEGVRVNAALAQLNLDSNLIELEGIKAIGDVLRTNDVLAQLDIGNSKMGGEGAKVIAEALRVNLGLKQLNAAHSDVNDEERKMLESVCELKGIKVEL